jgi:hypothetical protein
MAKDRKTDVIWNNVSTGVGTGSAVGHPGTMSNVAVFVTVGAAATISIEVGTGPRAAGINELPSTFVPYFKKDGSGALTLVFAGAGSACIDLSPFAPEHIRLSSSANVTATAYVVSTH